MSLRIVFRCWFASTPQTGQRRLAFDLLHDTIGELRFGGLTGIESVHTAYVRFIHDGEVLLRLGHNGRWVGRFRVLKLHTWRGWYAVGY